MSSMLSIDQIPYKHINNCVKMLCAARNISKTELLFECGYSKSGFQVCLETSSIERRKLLFETIAYNLGIKFEIFISIISDPVTFFEKWEKYKKYEAQNLYDKAINAFLPFLTSEDEKNNFKNALTSSYTVDLFNLDFVKNNYRSKTSLLKLLSICIKSS